LSRGGIRTLADCRAEPILGQDHGTCVRGRCAPTTRRCGWGAPYKTEAGYFFPYGYYLEIAVDRKGMTHVIWGEGLSYIGPGGSWYTRGR